MKDDEKITIEDIAEIEKAFSFQMPEILKEWYLANNGASIHRCIFSVDGYEVEVAKLVELKYGYLPLEKIIAMDRKYGLILPNMIPIARNSGGDYYYWDSKSGKVYLFLCNSIENPIWICQNIEEFFSLLQKNSQTSI